MMVGLNPERILQGLSQVDLQKRGSVRSFHLVKDYSMNMKFLISLHLLI